MAKKINFSLDKTTGRWVYEYGNNRASDTHNPACMKEILGVYTEHEVILKLPTEKENVFFWVTCKNYSIQSVEMVIAEDPNCYSASPVKKFYLLVKEL